MVVVGRRLSTNANKCGVSEANPVLRLREFAKFLSNFADYSKANGSVGIDELIAVEALTARRVVKLGCLA